jgi:hypothetical protein
MTTLRQKREELFYNTDHGMPVFFLDKTISKCELCYSIMIHIHNSYTKPKSKNRLHKTEKLQTNKFQLCICDLILSLKKDSSLSENVPRHGKIFTKILVLSKKTNRDLSSTPPDMSMLHLTPSESGRGDVEIAEGKHGRWGRAPHLRDREVVEKSNMCDTKSRLYILTLFLLLLSQFTK